MSQNVYVHTSNGMHIRHYTDSTSWISLDVDITGIDTDIGDLSCHSIIVPAIVPSPSPTIIPPTPSPPIQAGLGTVEFILFMGLAIGSLYLASIKK